MANESVVNDIALLLHRPCEPLFAPKSNGKVVFNVPEAFHTDRYKNKSHVKEYVGTDTNIKTVELNYEIELPNLDFTKFIEKHGVFSLFNAKHQQIASELIEILLKTKDPKNLLYTAAYCRDRVNPFLFAYALTVAVQNRNDFHHIQLPTIAEQFPGQFIDASVLLKLRDEGKYVNDEHRQPAEFNMNYTASDREPEQRLAYFREDIGVNCHHWHWHLVYPNKGSLALVQKDRRGELFYYMHNQIIARYNIERFCNNLERVKPLNNLRDPIAEGYFPKILRSQSNRTIPGRFNNSVLQDLNRKETSVIAIADLERWIDRICAAIDQGYCIKADSNERIPLDEPKGIDILGDIVEASSLSPNQKYYGNLHNVGHDVISYIHDPDKRYLEEAGVMANVETAMRDPIFYRWHAFIDSIFIKYKNTLPAYQKHQLNFDKVRLSSVEVKMENGGKPNELHTFWGKSDLDLSTGLDFGEGSFHTRITHLQHAPFEYTITVVNDNDTPKQGFFRIFLVPKVDDRGEPLIFNDQRCLAIEMDKFTLPLKKGSQPIRRKSYDSSVTIPHERTFRKLNRPAEDGSAKAQYDFCGCGWPDHMLLPKGTAAGMKFDLFVMVTDYELDRVDQETNWTGPCNDAFSFCGLKDQKYPEKRAMGFPFDKNTQLIPEQDVATLMEFDQRLPNVKLAECIIKFKADYKAT